MSKPDRIERIKALEHKLLDNPKGWTRAELARDLNVDRSTIKRDIDYILAKSLLPIEIVNNRIYIQKDAHVSQIEMNLDEMLALHQAVRLLVRKSSFTSSHYITLLNKLVHALTFHSPVISKCILDTAESINSGLNKKEIIKRTELLETLNRTWTHQNKILIRAY